MTPLDLYTLGVAELSDHVEGLGEPTFRAKQLHDWLYVRKAPDFDSMSNLPARMRKILAETSRLGSLEIATEQVASDGTIKRLYKLDDGQLIESVLMRYDTKRRTACISTQAGCAMGCVFCATGQMGFKRHLTATEIFTQAMIYARELQAVGERLSNVVFMGMGEPFHNYDATLQAARRIIDQLGIGARHITVSTVGIAPRIRELANEGLQLTLAVSLHEIDQAQRQALIPTASKWPIDDLLDACADYVDKTGRRITFEWALIAGENDSTAIADALGRRLAKLHCHLNLIPLNPTGGYPGAPTQGPSVDRFVHTLAKHGVVATVRVRRGIDIDAGCGQLRSRVERNISGQGNLGT